MAVVERSHVETISGALATAAVGPVAGVHLLPAGSRLSLVATLRDFAALESQWRRLETELAPQARIFQGYDWLSRWLKAYPEAAKNLALLAGHSGADLVFAWPLIKTRVGPVRVLRWLTEPHGQYGDVVVARGHCPRAWLEQAVAFLGRLRGIDAIRLRHVRDDAAAAAYLKATFRDARLYEKAPWLDLSVFAGEAAYDARYTASQRKRRKRIRKSLADAFGPLSFDILPPGPAADAEIRAAIAEKCQWIDERGRQNRVLCCQGLPGFLEDLSRTGSVVVSRLSAGGRPVSWEIGIRHGTTHFCFITSHVNALTGYSPARLHMGLSQRQALKNGMKTFDLLVPNDTYKESWSSAVMAVNDYYLPLTAIGWLYGRFYLEGMRPILRDAYYRMPAHWLRALKPLVGH